MTWSDVSGPAGADFSGVPGDDLLAARARDVLSLAREEAREIRKAALQEGFRRGFQEGMAHGRHELARLRAGMEAELDAVVAGLRQEYDRLAAGLTPQLVELVTTVARKVIGQELAAGDEAVFALTSGALRRVQEEGPRVLRVRPEDAVRLEGFRTELDRLAAAGKGLVVRQDPGVAGGCVIETERGVLDASVDKQLDRVSRALREASGIGIQGC